MKSKNFLISFIFFGSGQLSILSTFFFFIYIPLDSMTTPRNSIFFTFHTYFFGYIYKLFFFSLLNTFSTILLSLFGFSFYQYIVYKYSYFALVY